MGLGGENSQLAKRWNEGSDQLTFLKNIMCGEGGGRGLKGWMGGGGEIDFSFHPPKKTEINQLLVNIFTIDLIIIVTHQLFNIFTNQLVNIFTYSISQWPTNHFTYQLINIFAHQSIILPFNQYLHSKHRIPFKLKKQEGWGGFDRRPALHQSYLLLARRFFRAIWGPQGRTSGSPLSLLLFSLVQELCLTWVARAISSVLF